jgi:D-amino-acid oxidase
MEENILHTVRLDEVFYDKDGFSMPNQGSIKEHIICLRPAHKSGIPQVYCDKKEEKIISHNYCHAGNGFSLLFGCVNKSITNLETFWKSQKKNSNLKEQPIAVVGLGCMGLITALTLYNQGYKNIRLIGETFYNTPSFWAGGLLEFYSPFEDKQLKEMNQHFEETYINYLQIIQGKHPFLKNEKECIKVLDFYTDKYSKGSGLHHLSQKGIIPKVKETNIKFGNNTDLFKMFHLKTIHIVTNTFMQYLYEQILSLKIPIELTKITSFIQVKEEVIFNCTGLGSSILNNDKDVYPICGHGFILKDEKLSKHQYILNFSNLLPNSKYGGSLYFMPKLSGFVGGTYLENYYGNNKNEDLKQITNLIERAKSVFMSQNPLKKEFSPKF